MTFATDFPPLGNSSREGRRAFLDAWGDRLWAFWRDAFDVAIAGGEIDPSKALGRAWLGTDREAAGEIADRLIEKLREASWFGRASAWTATRRWYAWLIGHEAAVHRPRFVSLDDHALIDDRGGEREEHDNRADAVEALVSTWRDVLLRVAEGTGIASIELDWLWATVIQRRSIAVYLAERSDPFARSLRGFATTSARELAKSSSARGSSRGERIQRARAGAAACFRFNLASWDGGDPALADASRIFLGEAAPDAPHRPRADVGPEALRGFEEVLRRSAVAAAAVRETPPGLEHVGDAVAARAHRRGALRLLPRREELRLAAAWPAGTGTEEDER